MKYAICNELYVDWAFDKAFSHAAALGYTGLEIAPFTMSDSAVANAFEISADKRREVRDCAASHNLEIIGLHWLLAKTEGLHLTTNDVDVRKRTGEYLCELAQLCKDLGGQVMVFGSPPQRNIPDGVAEQQAFDNAVDVFKSAVGTFQELGVTLALEPLGPQEGNFMLTAESGIALAKAVNSPNVKLHLDVKAMSTEAKPIPDIIRDSKDWLVHFHANDTNRRGPGMGDVDFAPIIGALNEVAYDGWVSVEVFDYEPGVDALAGESIRYLEKIKASLAG